MMYVKMQNGIGANEFAESRKMAREGEENKNGKVKNGSVFGAEFAQKTDPVSVRKAQAQQKAMKLWTDAVGSQQKIDLEMEERMQRISDLRSQNTELQSSINSITESQNALKEKYGFTEGSQMEKDFELLIKQRKSLKSANGFSFTEEEIERLKEIKEANDPVLNECMSRYTELEKGKGIFQVQIRENLKDILEESSIVEGMKSGRLKSHAMIDAQKEKDEMMIRASKEAAGMLMNEVKDKIDEEQEEREEKAEEKAEKEKEEEERLEAIKDKVEETKKDEEDLEVVETEQLIQVDSVKTDVKQEVQKMVNDMSLLIEDLKGASVDKTL